MSKPLNPKEPQPRCPLCLECDTTFLTEDQLTQRSYQRCSNCHLVFVPKQFHLSAGDEKEIYDFHENNPNDAAYRKFLSRLSEPLQNFIPDKAFGLDFGCGPGPTLPILLQENGHEMNIYDLYYFNDDTVLNNTYDFVTATEVVEHLRDPAQTFDQLFGLLKKGGILGIMTKMIPKLEGFSSWHYTRDKTHIAFYAEETCRYIASCYNYEAHFLRNDVIIFTPET